jgi:hypothetical protein
MEMECGVAEISLRVSDEMLVTDTGFLNKIGFLFR